MNLTREEKLKIGVHIKTGAARVFSYDIKFTQMQDGLLGFITKKGNKTYVYIQDGLQDLLELGVGCHETLHDVLDHLARGEDLGVFEDEDKRFIFNLASDYIVNKILGIIIPRLSQYQELTQVIELVDRFRQDPSQEATTEGLYRLLLDSLQVEKELQAEMSFEIQGGYGQDGDNRQGQDKSQDGNQKQDGDNRQGQDKSQDGNQKQGNQINVKIYKVRYLDKRSGKTVLTRYEQVVEGDQQERNGSQERKESNQGYADKYSLLEKIKNAGSESQGLDLEFKIAKSRVSLAKQFQGYINNLKAGSKDYSFFRMSPRSMYITRKQGLQVPGGIDKVIRIFISIDSSGSISDKNYKEFLGIIINNARYLEGKVVFHDVETKEFDIKDPEIKRLITQKRAKRYFKGGTSLDKVLKIMNKDKRYKVGVFMTDLYMEIPARQEFNCDKIVWIIPRHDSASPPKFGEVIYV